MRVRAVCRRVALAVTVFVVLFGFSRQAIAQSQLVPLVTDLTPLPLSNQFGPDKVACSMTRATSRSPWIPARPTVFLMPGGGAPVRLFGTGDPIPGFPTGALSTISGLGFNNISSSGRK